MIAEKINNTKYTKEALIGSNALIEHRWAATVALEDGKEYTLEEAKAVLERFLEGKVD